MGIYDNLRRADIEQIAGFILHSTESKSDRQPGRLEEKCSTSEKLQYDLFKKIVNFDEGSPDFSELIQVSSEVQTNYFTLGMQAGMNMLISLMR